MKVLFRAETIRQDFKTETEYLKCIDGVWYGIGNSVEIGKHNVILPAKQKVEICGDDAMVDIHYEIKPETRAIHFEDMLDSENNPIFASLQENGKGGDKFKWDGETFIVWFDKFGLTINATNKDNFDSSCHDTLQEWFDNKNKAYDLKVIGVQ